MMTPLDASPDFSPNISSEEDEPIPGILGGELVNDIKQLSERDLSQAQLQQDSPGVSDGESTQLQPVRDKEEELTSAPNPRAHRTEKRQKPRRSARLFVRRKPHLS